MKKLIVIFLLLLLFIDTAFNQPQLSFRFSNPLFIDGSPPTLWFDVEVKASEAGTFLRDFQVYLNYNPSTFGANIVANGKVTITSLNLMQNHYQTVNLADNTSSKFAVITEASEEMNQTGSIAWFNEIPITFTGFLRFEIDIADTNETCGISFDEVLMNGGQYRQSTITIEPLAYLNPCIYENSLENLSLTGQEIMIPSGWSGISGYMTPYDNALENLFNPIINELIILEDFYGVFIPGQNVNTLGTWNPSSGYLIKVNDNCQLRMMGSETNNKTLNLNEGWNLIPVLSSCDVNTAAFFAAVLPNLVIVKDVAGLGTYWPDHGINTMPLLKPGKGYFVKMASGETISFQECNN